MKLDFFILNLIASKQESDYKRTGKLFEACYPLNQRSIESRSSRLEIMYLCIAYALLNMHQPTTISKQLNILIVRFVFQRICLFSPASIHPKRQQLCTKTKIFNSMGYPCIKQKNQIFSFKCFLYRLSVKASLTLYSTTSKINQVPDK